MAQINSEKNMLVLKVPRLSIIYSCIFL